MELYSNKKIIRKKEQHIEAVTLLDTIHGSGGIVMDIIWSRKGKYIAVTLSNGLLNIYNSTSGAQIHRISNISLKSQVCFSDSELSIAYISREGFVQIRELSSPNSSSSIQLPNDRVYHVSYMNDAKCFVVFDGESYFQIGALDQTVINRQLNRTINQVFCFNVSANITVSLYRKSVIEIRDFKTQTLIHLLSGHKGVITKLITDIQGNILASLSEDGIVKVWDVENGKNLMTIESLNQSCETFALNSNGSKIALRYKDGSVLLYSCITGNLMTGFNNPKLMGGGMGLSFHPTLSKIAISGIEKMSKSYENILSEIQIWEVESKVIANVFQSENISFSSAKVVLLGESNVGKSYLAHRIITKRRPKDGTIRSTHGMKFWSIKPTNLNPKESIPEGQRREIVLWDLGGQEEYRLIHQLFLNDTTLALVLLDPTRGTGAYNEVKAWDKYLQKQLHGQKITKFLIGTKLDNDRKFNTDIGLRNLVKDCGFHSYYETSAITGKGIKQLCSAISDVIRWDELEKTSRPELFQKIRDIIEGFRKKGVVVLKMSELYHALSVQDITEDEIKAINIVTDQLSLQGYIARSEVSNGEVFFVLQLEIIEKYAGSLIKAARNNPRGVAALETRQILMPDFDFPGLTKKERLSSKQEKNVLDCTLQLLLDHGICFEHEGLLVFPSLFNNVLDSGNIQLSHTIALYYDISGAIDNIYASLISSLVLAKDFGRLRLWSDRADFDIIDGGVCGIKKVTRDGGFAHMDVYFDEITPESRKNEFISVVEEHLQSNGIVISENIEVSCPRGFKFEQEFLLSMINDGKKDILCPLCEIRHSFSYGAKEIRNHDHTLLDRTWALKTEITKRKQIRAEQIIEIVNRPLKKANIESPIRILHLSDLHFTSNTITQTKLEWLIEDIKQKQGLNINSLDYIVVTGDFTNKGAKMGFERAYEFLSTLRAEFELSAERFILVPGNHDVCDLKEAYQWSEDIQNLKEGEWIKKEDIFLVQDPAFYPKRFQNFTDLLYHKFLQKPYPLEYILQGSSIPFWDTGIQFLTLNSSWQIDQFHRQRANINNEAIVNCLRESKDQEIDAISNGVLKEGKKILKIAVWHHAVTAPGYKMSNLEFLEHLGKNEVRLILHGDIHEMSREIYCYHRKNNIHILGSGSFGADKNDRPESTPLQYNLLEISRDLSKIHIHTRCQNKQDGAWKGWHEWDDPKGGDGKLAYFDIEL